MLIRTMQESDISRVAEIERYCFSTPWTEAMLLEELSAERSFYCVAETDGMIVGYMGFYRVADEGNITNIAVLPDYRRRGIARALLSTFIELAEKEELAFLTLEVRKSNEAAIRLYESFGFERVGVRPRYYDNAEDAVLMTRYFNRE